MNSSAFLRRLKFHSSPRKPWLWLVLLFAVYSLGLGLIAPRILEQQLQALVHERLHSELVMEKISINPFTLELKVHNAKLQGDELTRPLGFAELRVNLQIASLWHRALRFKEMYLLGIFGELQRAHDGSSNFSRLGDVWAATGPQEEIEEPAENSTELPRLHIADLQVQISEFHIQDEVPDTAFATQVGPLTLRVHDLSTLREDKGQHSLQVQTPDGLQLSWQGDISVNPFASRGAVEFSGPVFPLLARYIQDDILFAIPSGDLATRFEYELKSTDAQDQPWHFALSQLAVDIQQLQVRHKTTDAPLMELPALAVREGSLLWPEQKVELPLIELSGGKVWPVMQADGNLNFAQLLVPTTDPEPQPSSASEAAPWSISAPLLRLTDWQTTWRDETLLEPAEIQLEKIQLTVNGFSTAENASVQLQSQLEIAGGQIALTGTLQPQPLANLDLDFQITQLPLSIAQAYVTQQALVTLDSGTLTAEGKIRAADLDALTLGGQLSVDELVVAEQSAEAENARKIFGWNQLALEEISLNLQTPLSLAVKRINLRQPYTDFAVAADGTHTLSRVLRPQEENAQPENVEENATQSPTPEIQIGNIQVEGGSGIYSDASLPLPFRAHIQNLNGSVSALDTNSRTPAKMQLNGQVGQYGQVQISGRLLPLQPEQNTELALQFENLDIPDFSPYSVKFAGREIASGKVDLDLKYKVNDSKLLGENAMVLHNFELGKKIDHPGAADLPLDLAVALLKDSSGRISLDVPVSGDMNDPQFAYGKVIGQALRKVLTSIVTSPFRLLGNLAGSDSKQFGRVVFVPGGPDVSLPQQEKLHQLAAVMQKRPDLQLQIPAGFSISRDTAPMQTQQFLQRVQQELKEDLDLLQTRHLRVLEKFYEAQQLTPTIQELRQSSTRVPEGKTAPELDQLAYGTKLQDALIKAEILPEGALENLGLIRRTNIHQVLLAAATDLADRVTLTPGGDMPGKEKEKKVYVELGLKTQGK